jgi:hypothetical protein
MFFGACTETMERCLEEGKEAGLLSPDLPSKQLSEFVLAQIQGSFLLRKTHKDPKILESSFDVLRGLLRQWSP